MRDIEAIDSELRLVAALRRCGLGARGLAAAFPDSIRSEALGASIRHDFVSDVYAAICRNTVSYAGL